MEQSKHLQEAITVRDMKFNMLWRQLKQLPWWEERKDTVQAVWNLAFHSGINEAMTQLAFLNGIEIES